MEDTGIILKEKIKDFVNLGESAEIEFKSARGGFPGSFWETYSAYANSGMMLVSKTQYFKGGRSICRNPILQNIFMRLGGAERAGSGVDKIVGGWAYLDLPSPYVEEETRPDCVVLSLPLKETQVTPQVTPQVQYGGKADIVEQRKKQIWEFCKSPKSRNEIMTYLGLKDRKSFRHTYLDTMIAEGRLSMMEPDKPNSNNQRYVSIT
ncbi:MAG: hypothetical protein K2M69_09065 [Muribaculaceae bacterium]|nr:hypothetical protein [Muribaculaceae bacterium]